MQIPFWAFLLNRFIQNFDQKISIHLDFLLTLNSNSTSFVNVFCRKPFPNIISWSFAVENHSHKGTNTYLGRLDRKVFIYYRVAGKYCGFWKVLKQFCLVSFFSYEICLSIRVVHTLLMSRSERGHLVRILASHPGIWGSNPIAAPKSLVMD